MRAWFDSRARCALLVAFALLVPVAAAAQGSPWAEAREIEDRLDNAAMDEARSLSAGLRALYGDDPAVLWAEGNLAFHEGRYADAQRALDLAVSLGANDRVRALRDLVVSTIEVTNGYERYTTSGGHFEILYHPRDEVLLPFAERALEGAYHEIGYDIGFWPEPPVRIEFYPRAQFLARTSSLSAEAIETSGTIALCKYNKLMVTSPRGTARGYGWLDTLSHEYVHYAVSHLVNRDLPIWLHEALAKYLESRWSGDRTVRLEPSREDLLGERIAANDLITFEQMHPSMAYLPSPEDASTAYAQVFTIMEYLVDRRGSGAIRELLLELREGVELERAFAAVMGVDFDVFEQSWMTWLRARPRVELPGRFDDEHVELLSGEGEAGVVNEYEELGSVEARDLLRLGELLRARGHVAASVVQYQRAELLLGSANPMLQNAMARALLDLDRNDDALHALREVGDWYPDFYRSHLHRGMALNELGRYDEAVEALYRAAGVNPFDPEVHRQFEVAWSALGDAEAAARARRFARMVEN
jgi:tetratricopeptide (TPR) repeat protein